MYKEGKMKPTMKAPKGKTKVAAKDTKKTQKYMCGGKVKKSK